MYNIYSTDKKKKRMKIKIHFSKDLLINNFENVHQMLRIFFFVWSQKFLEEQKESNIKRKMGKCRESSLSGLESVGR